MISNLRLFSAILALSISGCASVYTPVIDRTHPASADAPETPLRLASRLQGSDEATRRTHELLARRQREATAAERETPTHPLDLEPNAAMPPAHESHP